MGYTATMPVSNLRSLRGAGIYLVYGVEYQVLVYPELGKVRIFKLMDGKYKFKLMDGKYKKVYEGKDRFCFDLCDIEVDFTKAWKK